MGSLAMHGREHVALIRAGEDSLVLHSMFYDFFKRRNPDAKWRMRPGALEQRQKEQAEVLDRAVTLLKPEGRIAYVTCSVLEEENGAQVRAFLGRNPSFAIEAPDAVTQVLGERAFVFSKAARLSGEGILMTPRLTGTDGFFVALLRRGG